MPFSAKRPAYSDNPSEASHSVIVTKRISLAATQLVEDPSKPNQLEGNVVLRKPQDTARSTDLKRKQHRDCR
jgi:hypothetical protein